MSTLKPNAALVKEFVALGKKSIKQVDGMIGEFYDLYYKHKELVDADYIIHRVFNNSGNELRWVLVHLEALVNQEKRLTIKETNNAY